MFLRTISCESCCACEKVSFTIALASVPRLVDGRGLPLGNYLHSASPAEVKLAETTLAAIRVRRCHQAGRPRQKPLRVIADKAYDSDPSRDRTDLPAQEKSHSTRDAGWPSLASLQKAMDCRTDQRLARKLPTLGRAIRPFAHNLRCVLSYRLLHDRLTEGCAIAASKNH